VNHDLLSISHRFSQISSVAVLFLSFPLAEPPQMRSAFFAVQNKMISLHKTKAM